MPVYERSRPGDRVARAAPVTECTPDNIFGVTRQGSEATLIPDDGTHRTEQQYRQDQARNDYELQKALYQPMLDFATRGAFGRALDVVETYDTLTREGTGPIAYGKIRDKLVEQGLQALEKKLDVPMLGEMLEPFVTPLVDMAEDIVVDIAASGGGREAPPAEQMQKVQREHDQRYSSSDARRERNDIQAGVDRSEHRQRVRPGTMIA